MRGYMTRIAAILACGALMVAHATSYTWNGSASGLWSNPANWTPNGVPVSGDTLNFPVLAPAVVTNDLVAGSVFTIVGTGEYELHGNEIVSASIDASGVSMHAPLRLNGNATYRLYKATGAIDVGPHALSMATYEISGPLSGTGSITFGQPNAVQSAFVVIRGTHSFNGLITAGPMNIRDATLPARLDVAILQGGNAAVGHVRVTEEISTDSTITTGDLVLDGDIAVNTMGWKVVVNGTVTLGTASGAQPYSASPTAGAAYIMLENDGTDPVAGTFAGQPEGSVVKIGPHHYRVSYVGGDGNDITFTKTHFPVEADLDFDGRADLLWYHEGEGSLHRMSLDGAAVKVQETVYREPNLDWRVVGQGDFDGNGVTDVLWRNTATGEVYIQLFGYDGRPAGGAVVYREANPDWRIIGTRDLDWDGNADILWWNGSTGQVYVMLISGTRILQQGFFHTFSDLNWKPAGIGLRPPGFRFAGDSYGVWRHAITGQVITTTFAFRFASWSTVEMPLFTEPNLAWKILGTPDLTGDKRADLLWFNEATGELYGMTMNGNLVGGGAVIHRAGPGWKPVAFADYDGDGVADVAWRNEIDGRVHVTLIDGASLTVKAQATVHVEADPAWKVLGTPASAR